MSMLGSLSGTTLPFTPRESMPEPSMQPPRPERSVSPPSGTSCVGPKLVLVSGG
jgi:hypothetical protein